MKRILLIIGILLLNILLINYLYNNVLIKKRFINSVNNKFILNSFGSINGDINTNSIDALEYNYSNGFKLFEVNLSLTSDNELVLVSGWNLTDYKTSIGINYYDDSKINVKDTNTPTYKEFMKYKIQGKYKATDYSMLLDFMKKNKDTYFIIDIGYRNNANVEKILNYIVNNTSNSILNRMIFNIYNDDMLKKVLEYKKIKLLSMLYIKNNYKDINEFIKYCKDNKVFSFNTTISNINRDDMLVIKKSGLISIVTNINDEDKINYLNNIGVDLIMTDNYA